jgi:Leucine-rich repeat (LRR) protein
MVHAKIIVSFMLSIAIFSLAEPAFAEKRTIIFPADKCYGQVVLVSRGARARKTNRLDEIEPSDPAIASAQGKVVLDVPANCYLGFEGNRVLYEHPEQIKKITARGIEVLKVRFNSMENAEDKLCDQMVKYISHFQDLRILKFKGSDLSDDGFKTLGALPNLHTLDISNTPVTAKSLNELKRYPNLQTLAISNIDLKGADLKQLQTLPELAVLYLRGSRVSDVAIPALAKCKSLTIIDLSNNATLRGRNLDLFKGLKNLKEIDFSLTGVSGESLMGLKGLPLKRVKFSREAVDDKTMIRLQETFPNTQLERQRKAIHRRQAPVTGEEKAIFAPLK